MLTVVILALWAVMLAARDTPVGKALHRLLVEWPCRRMAPVSRGQVMLAMLMLALIIALIWLLEDDGRMIVTMGLPDVMALASAVDLSVLLDVALAAAVSAGAVRVRAIRTFLTARPGRSRRRAGRSRRAPRPGGRDEDRPRLALRPLPTPRFA